MRLAKTLKYFSVPSEVSSSMHENISRGYYEISPKGERKFVSYDTDEMGKLHSFLSPSRDRYKHMKWTKTHDWKDQKKAKKSHWKETKTFGGLNTVSK